MNSATAGAATTVGGGVVLAAFTEQLVAAAIARYGRARNLRLASFGEFGVLRPCAPVDLLGCSDVLHYLPTRELDRGPARRWKCSQA